MGAGWTDGEYAAAVEEVRAAIAAGRRLPGQPRPASGRSPRRRSGQGRRGAVDPLQGTARGRVRPGRSCPPRRSSSSPGAGAGSGRCPIKGTRPLGGSTWSAKDSAEHMMIVDLERQRPLPGLRAGLGPLARADVRAAAPAAEPSRLPRVEGRLRAEIGLTELLEATFPGRLDHGAQDRRIDHIARSGRRTRRLDGRARHGASPTATLELALDHSHLRRRRGARPPLGR